MVDVYNAQRSVILRLDAETDDSARGFAVWRARPRERGVRVQAAEAPEAATWPRTRTPPHVRLARRRDRHDRALPRPGCDQRQQGLGERVQRDRRRRLPHARPRRDLAGRQPGGHSADAPVPRHRGVRRQPCGRHVVGNRPGLADLPHRRRGPDVDARLPEHRAERVLRLHDVLQPQGRPGRLRSAGRAQVPGHQDDGRRTHLERRRPGGNARRASRRVRVRSQRAVPDFEPRSHRLVRIRRRSRRASSRRATGAVPGPWLPHR